MITLGEDYDLKGTIITIGFTQMEGTTPRVAPLTTVWLNPSVMV